MAFGSMELMLLLALGGAGSSNDLVSWMDPGLYFQSREIKLEPAPMTEIAGKEPKDPQTSIAQLLAIRWLGENAPETRRFARAREVLEQIAQGKAAQDRLGFSKEYAARALARLDGKTLPPALMPENSVRAEALAWFPQECTFVAAADLRSPTNEALALTDDRFRNLLTGRIGAEELGHFYDFADKVGNIRFDRAALALTFDMNGNQPQKIYVRVTGLLDHKPLADFIKTAKKNENQEVQVKEEKGPRGETITLISSEKEPPAFGLIGDTEFFMCGPAGDGESLPLLRQMLETRAGTSPSVLTGPLAGRLKDVSGKANAMVVGELGNGIRQLIARGIKVVPIPRAFTFEASSGKTMILRVAGEYGGEDAAKAAVDTLVSVRNLAVEELAQLPAELMKPALVALVRKVVVGVKIDVDGTAARVSAEIPQETVKALQEWVEQRMQAIRQEPQP